jgi:tripartite-type tricarboxylate transporter receptor subunit TctC
MWIRLVAICFAFSLGIAQAEEYPTKPIKIVVSFPAGGPTDIAARFIANSFSKDFGHPAVVENIAGAAGIVGANRVAKAAPDGYTLLMSSSNPFSVAQLLYSNVPFDTFKDFAPISVVIGVPSYVIVNPKLPVHTLQELIAYARAHPGKLSYASAGIGTSTHLGMELFKKMTGTSILHVPYKGSAPSIASVVAGETDMVMASPPYINPLVKDGRLRMLAVTTPKRTGQFPDVPTVAESGLPGFDSYTWFALAAPAGVPREIIQKLYAETVKALADPEVHNKLEGLGTEVIGSTPEEFAALQISEAAKWGKLIKELAIKVQ